MSGTTRYSVFKAGFHALERVILSVFGIVLQSIGRVKTRWYFLGGAVARADLGLNIGFCCHLICAGVIGTPVCWRGIEVGGGDVVGGDGNSNGSGLADGYGGNVRWERCSMITDYNVTTVWMSQCRTMKLRKQKGAGQVAGRLQQQLALQSRQRILV